MNGAHDMGGMHGFGPILVEPDEPVFHGRWQSRVFAFQRGLRAAGVMNLNQFRLETENLPPALYLASSYYERWLMAVERVLERTGGVAPAESLPEWKAEQQFTPGDPVIARNEHPKGHTRLPRYVRGKRGTVERVHGPYLLPDTDAHHVSLDWEPVYTVRFEARELWGEAAEPRTTVTVDLWQSYLDEEPA